MTNGDHGLVVGALSVRSGVRPLARRLLLNLAGVVQALLAIGVIAG
jgi:hypothetical protein